MAPKKKDETFEIIADLEPGRTYYNAKRRMYATCVARVLGEPPRKVIMRPATMKEVKAYTEKRIAATRKGVTNG